MLVFTRRSGEGFSVGDAHIKVTIEEGQIRVVAIAPMHIPILIDDIVTSTRKQNRVSKIITDLAKKVPVQSR